MSASCSKSFGATVVDSPPLHPKRGWIHAKTHHFVSVGSQYMEVNDWGSHARSISSDSRCKVF
jgi:hypothetical protein